MHLFDLLQSSGSMLSVYLYGCCKTFEPAVRIACMVLNASFEASYTRNHELVQSVVTRVLLWTEPTCIKVQVN